MDDNRDTFHSHTYCDLAQYKTALQEFIITKYRKEIKAPGPTSNWINKATEEKEISEEKYKSLLSNPTATTAQINLQQLTRLIFAPATNIPAQIHNLPSPIQLYYSLLYLFCNDPAHSFQLSRDEQSAATLDNYLALTEEKRRKRELRRREFEMKQFDSQENENSTDNNMIGEEKHSLEEQFNLLSISAFNKNYLSERQRNPDLSHERRDDSVVEGFEGEDEKELLQRLIRNEDLHSSNIPRSLLELIVSYAADRYDCRLVFCFDAYVYSNLAI
jgi:hypothetical protein